MQLEPVAPRELRLETSDPGTAPSGLHRFASSGSSTGEALLALASHTLGASHLAFRRALSGVVRAAFESPQIFRLDASLVTAFDAFDLEVLEGCSSVVPPIKASKPSESEERRSLDAILSELKEEPIEDGVNHRSEHALDAHLDTFGGAGIARRLSEGEPPLMGGAILRLLSRSSKVGLAERNALVRWGLSAANVDIRDAAVQAVENWEERSLVELLRAHNEPVAWLAQYAKNVVRDLEG